MIDISLIFDHLTLWGAFFIGGVTFGFFIGYVVVTSTEKRL